MHACRRSDGDGAEIERDTSLLLSLLRSGTWHVEWAFCEDEDELLASALPSLPGGEHLRLCTFRANGDSATGGRVWHSAPVLCRWLREHASSTVRSRDILELGSGTGACGLFAAGLGASSVCLTDGMAALLPLLEHNAKLNQKSLLGAIQISALRWGACAQGEPLPTGPFDLIIGSDVIYDASEHAALCITLRELIRRQRQRPPRIVLASMPRQPKPVDASGGRFSEAALLGFEATAAAHGMRVAVPGRGAAGETRSLASSALSWSIHEFRDATPFLVEVCAVKSQEADGEESIR